MCDRDTDSRWICSLLWKHCLMQTSGCLSGCCPAKPWFSKSHLWLVPWFLLIAWCFSCLSINLCAGAGTLPAMAACTPFYHLTPYPAVSCHSVNSLLCLTYSSYSCLPIPLYLLLLFTEKVIDFISDAEAGEWLWVWVQIGLQCKTVSPSSLSSPPPPQEKIGQRGEKLSLWL